MLTRLIDDDVNDVNDDDDDNDDVDHVDDNRVSLRPGECARECDWVRLRERERERERK